MGDPILESLQKLEGKLDLAVKDFQNLRAGIAGIGSVGTQAELLLAGTNSRLDLVDERLARIADKLDLVRRDLAAQAGGAQGSGAQVGGAMEACK